MDALVWKQVWKASVCYKTSRDKDYARDNEKGHKDRRREKEGTRQEKLKRKKEQCKVAVNSSISKPLCRNSLCLPSPSH